MAQPSIPQKGHALTPEACDKTDPEVLHVSGLALHGGYPETKFEAGIVKTIKWYLNHQDWVEEVTSGDYQKYYERMYGKR